MKEVALEIAAARVEVGILDREREELPAQTPLSADLDEANYNQ